MRDQTMSGRYVDTAEAAIQSVENGNDLSSIPPSILLQLLSDGAMFHRLKAAPAMRIVSPVTFLNNVLECIGAINDRVHRLRVGIHAFMLLHHSGMYGDAGLVLQTKRIEIAIGAVYNTPRY